MMNSSTSGQALRRGGSRWLLAWLWALALPVAGQVNSDGNPRCLPLNSIKKMEIVDDQTILFHMRGGDVWINRLPHRCPGLRRNTPIKYRTSLNRLCDLDIITVLDFDMRPGASCGLGKFGVPGDDVLDGLFPDGGPKQPPGDDGESPLADD
jgi:hypothetical protein